MTSVKHLSYLCSIILLKRILRLSFTSCPILDCQPIIMGPFLNHLVLRLECGLIVSTGEARADLRVREAF
jgi:hypothetical protein